MCWRPLLGCGGAGMRVEGGFVVEVCGLVRTFRLTDFRSGLSPMRPSLGGAWQELVDATREWLDENTDTPALRRLVVCSSRTWRGSSAP